MNRYVGRGSFPTNKLPISFQDAQHLTVKGHVCVRDVKMVVESFCATAGVEDERAELG